MLEQTIEKHAVCLVKQHQGIAIKLTDPTHAGLPDRLVLLPEGKICFIEFKAPGKKPRPLQQHRHKQLQQLGHLVHTVDNTKQTEKIIHDLLHAP